jgi:hypothetical protein
LARRLLFLESEELFMTKLVTLSLLVTSLVACHRRDTDGDELAAELAADSSNVSQAEGSMLASIVEGAEGASGVAPATPEGVAAFIQMRAPTRFSPAGCATATRSGSTVTLVFAGCTGPRGLRTVDGTITVNAMAAPSGIAITATGTDVQIGQATIDLDSMATYSVANGTASLVVSTTSSGVGPLGREITHDGDYTVTWTATCVAIEGAWSTEAGDLRRSTTADLMRCQDECPSGNVTRNTFNNRVITLTFDGTSTATWSTSAGRSGTFQLSCGL